MNTKILSNYLGLAFVAFLLFLVFIYLERNQYVLKLNDNDDLTKKSIHILKQFVDDKAVKFDIYSNSNTLLSKKIDKFLNRFKQHNSEIKTNFIDPITNPSKVKFDAISMQGEMALSFIDTNLTDKINITELSESAVINAMLRLQNNADDWVVFAQGYGMKTIEEKGNSGLSKLLVYLKKIGIQVARMPLNPTVSLADNVKLIVIPAPQQSLDEDIVQWLKKQTQQGISLWWLDDVGIIKQTQLELAFDAIIGTKQKLEGDVFSAVVTEFPPHQITEKFNQPLYIAEAKDVNILDSTAFIKTDTGKTLAISKQHKNSRVIITGDADFISNQYIDAAANKAFTIRIIDWLLYHDDRVNLQVKINENTQLFLSKTQLLSISIIFLIIFPLILLIIAWRQWKNNVA